MTLKFIDCNSCIYDIDISKGNFYSNFSSYLNSFSLDYGIPLAKRSRYITNILYLLVEVKHTRVHFQMVWFFLYFFFFSFLCRFLMFTHSLLYRYDLPRGINHAFFLHFCRLSVTCWYMLLQKSIATLCTSAELSERIRLDHRTKVN